MLQLLRPVLPNLSHLFSTFTLNTPRYFLDFELELVRTPLKYRILREKGRDTYYYRRHFSFKTIVISWMNVMLDFICIGPIDLPCARRKRQHTK